MYVRVLVADWLRWRVRACYVGSMNERARATGEATSARASRHDRADSFMILYTSHITSPPTLYRPINTTYSAQQHTHHIHPSIHTSLHTFIHLSSYLFIYLFDLSTCVSTCCDSYLPPWPGRPACRLRICLRNTRSLTGWPLPWTFTRTTLSTVNTCNTGTATTTRQWLFHTTTAAAADAVVALVVVYVGVSVNC